MEDAPIYAHTPALLSAEQEAARYQREAGELLFDVLANGNPNELEQAVTDAIAHLLAEHEADNRALVAQIRQSEARAAEAEAQVAMLRVELGEQERELSYERQMRQETEKAMSALADRVKWQTAEMAEQERAKLLLIQETHRWSAAVKTLGGERVTPEAPYWGNGDHCLRCNTLEWQARYEVGCNLCAGKEDEDFQQAPCGCGELLDYAGRCPFCDVNESEGGYE